MGEVYRACDTRLGRDVAIKVLPDHYAANVERLARFEQEARAAAALNHPNILAVYDIGAHDGAPYIVSELLEGETLREAIPGLPVRKAIEYAIQIAHGLAVAHEKGIVHRDLKPENIFVTTDGRLKILDFGLVKLAAVEAALGGGSVLLTTPAVTRPTPNTLAGVVLGTVGYMSPEQVRGLPADHRADIFAFGAILFEMLYGQRAFEGETTLDTMMAIAKEAPALPTGERRLPPALVRIVDRCLDKHPAGRFQSTRDLAFALESLSSHSETSVVPVVAPPKLARRERLAWSATAVCLVALAGAAVAGAMGVFGATAPIEPAVRFQIPSPGRSVAQMFTLSPDGQSLAFVTSAGGPDQLWVRPLDTLAPRAMLGTDGARYPFWSPDGSYLGFFAEGKLRKIAVAGGPAQTLADAADGRGGTWNRDGVILFSAGPTNPLLRVSEMGGVPTPVTALGIDDSGGGHRFPVFLPDGTHFLYNVTSDDPRTGGVYVGSMLSGEGARRVLPDGSNAVFVRPARAGSTGHLLFRREQTLMAQPFEPDRLDIVGGPFPVAEQVPEAGNAGFGAFSASGDRLVYRSGGAAFNRELAWVDRAGIRVRAVTKPAALAQVAPALSPDQNTVAIRIAGGQSYDIWLQDMERDVMSRFTFRAGNDLDPVWSPDGRRVIFVHQAADTFSRAFFQKPAGGNGEEELVLHVGVNARLLDWSGDGKWVVFSQQAQETSVDLWLLPLGGDRKPVPYLQTPFNERNARFAPSPDGGPRGMAYESDESGEQQVYVQAIPASGAKYQISTTGGTQPAWRRDGRELFYLSADQKVMSVPMVLGTNVEPGTPRELFEAAGVTGFAPSADGQRFLINTTAGADAGTPQPITVVLNWTAGLTK
jgi:Tol biopolymer transport system component